MANEDTKIILFTGKPGKSKTHDWFSTFNHREIESVVVDCLWTDSGFYEFNNTERKFVPSFDSKEKDVYILSFSHKEEGQPDITLTAKYDHKVGTMFVNGNGFDRALFKLYLK